ncbi:hypothetical protein LTS18_010509, partial [Coniosporium uncinatum]
ANETGERELKDISKDYATFSELLSLDRRRKGKRLTEATEPPQPSDTRRFMIDHKTLDDQGRRFWGPKHLDTGIKTTDNQGQLWTLTYELNTKRSLLLRLTLELEVMCAAPKVAWVRSSESLSNLLQILSNQANLACRPLLPKVLATLKIAGPFSSSLY